MNTPSRTKCKWCDSGSPPTFILDSGNEHLPEPGIGPADLRKATSLRRWVHDLRSTGEGVVQCDEGDGIDNLLESICK